MVNVKISKDINAQKSKMFWGFTGRQILFTAIAIVFSLLINCVLDFSKEIRPFLTVLLAIPFLCCGWININGLPFEKFAAIWIRNNTTNKERLFINESLGDYINVKRDKPVKGKNESQEEK